MYTDPTKIGVFLLALLIAVAALGQETKNEGKKKGGSPTQADSIESLKPKGDFDGVKIMTEIIERNKADLADYLKKNTAIKETLRSTSSTSRESRIELSNQLISNLEIVAKLELLIARAELALAEIKAAEAKSKAAEVKMAEEMAEEYEKQMPYVVHGWMSEGRSKSIDDFRKGTLRKPEAAVLSTNYLRFHGNIKEVRETIILFNAFMKKALERDRELRKTASATAPFDIKKLRVELKKDLSIFAKPYAGDVEIILSLSEFLAETEALTTKTSTDTMWFALTFNRTVAEQAYTHMLIRLNVSGVTYRPDLESDRTHESHSIHSEFKKTFIKPPPEGVKSSAR